LASLKGLIGRTQIFGLGSTSSYRCGRLWTWKSKSTTTA